MLANQKLECLPANTRLNQASSRRSNVKNNLLGTKVLYVHLWPPLNHHFHLSPKQDAVRRFAYDNFLDDPKCQLSLSMQ